MAASGDRDALHLAPRELGGPVAGAAGQTDVLEQLERASPPLGRPHASLGHGELDVFPGGQHRQEVEALKDEAQPQEAQPGELPVGQALQPGAEHLHGAARRGVDPAQQLQQGGLAAARRSHDGHMFPAADRERDAAQRVDRLAADGIVLPQVVGDEYRVGVDRSAQVASARKVAAIGARAASQAG